MKIWRLSELLMCILLGFNQVTSSTFDGCKDDYVIKHGHADYAENATAVNRSLHVVCNVGYEIRGDHDIICLGNGTWSNSTTCVKIDTSIDVNVIIVAAVIFVVAAVSCVVVLLCFKRSEKVCLTKDIEGPDLQALDMEIKVWGRFRPEVIKIAEFPSYVRELHDNNNAKFAEGFRLLNERSPIHSTTAAENPACRLKIRYSNILPFDHSRVILQSRDDKESSEFINANYIPGYTSQQEYIATQGPVAETKNDFWRMIWEQDIEIIVMLTKRIESGKGSLPRNASLERHWLVQTFDPYWPDEVQGPVYYGEIIVRLQSESVMTDHVIRKIEIQLGTDTKHVTQFQFLGWPDTGCPKKTWSFINFVTMVRKFHIYSHGKHTVVHCSTGVGRTGMFIAVDRLLQQVGDREDIDVFSVVLNMRNYRYNLVKTEEQFIYVYECVRHFITMDDDSDYGEEIAESQYSSAADGQETFDNTAFLED